MVSSFALAQSNKLSDLWLMRRCGRSIDVTFHDQKDGSVKTVQVPLGQSLLEAAHNNDIDLEGTYVVSWQLQASNAHMSQLQTCISHYTALQEHVKGL